MKTIIDFTQEHKNVLKEIKTSLNILILSEDPYEIEETRKLLNDSFDKLDKLSAEHRLIETRDEE